MAAEIPRSVLEYVTDEVNALSADAQARVLRVLESIEWTPDNIAAGRDIVIEALASVMPAYTDAAAQAGADLYDAVREAAVGEAMGATAVSGYEPDATDGAVRAFVQDIVDGKPVEAFNRKVLERVDRDIRVAENVSVAENAALDPLEPRYARVPTGPETCEWCVMLASRGFDFKSERSAVGKYKKKSRTGVASHGHPGCDCRIVQGYPDMTVEGYDPRSYYEMWRRSEEMKAAGTPREQRDAVLAAMRDRLIPHYSTPPTELVSIYQRGLDSAWSGFKSSGKTRKGYESTVEAFLADMGDASGADFSAEFMAKPDGNELWAATKLAGEFESVRFRYADYRSPNPDFLLDGEMAELKNPSSRKKVTNRLSDIPRQFSPYPDERRVGIVSTIYLPDDVSYVKETSQRFVNDGTLDEVMVILSDGTTERLSKQ